MQSLLGYRVPNGILAIGDVPNDTISVKYGEADLLQYSAGRTEYDSMFSL